MQFTVKEIANLTGTTVKTLHHYHKIGLLMPCEISGSGYRLYGMKELERLQQILFYRELDFSLKDIKKALEDEPSRLECLRKQHELLDARRQRLDCLFKTLAESIDCAGKGEIMDKTAMFQGLKHEEWEKALAEQNDYLKEKYGYDMIKDRGIQVEELNDKAQEAQWFLKSVCAALQNRWPATDQRLYNLLEEHLDFLNGHGQEIDKRAFAGQTRFFLEDEFHRNMLESMQLGLSYYLCFAAETFAALN
ncbi:MerR family transcriptional regulator [Desulfosporosinus sp. PR]|uniref:MerR family transcriptional regulator n=1 Tax=Candidatus Desulfosporosinus nitrosoreducens TaxID=3401928 RepID=UPI0027F4E506|nr:MerR family transcriptional regulator [Desulfosporosinus sp. PR]MDQ7093722.1 MerR family transcriptional regulator [Desulfosporosinus sp. PR]